ncbi:MAG: NifB/NifX family molybdenum-iron cluster-binding protein [Candidatus Bathyarchaeia archaeon]
MIKRIVIPAEDEGGLNSRLSEHFGRAPYFVVVDLDENNNILSVQVVPTAGEHFSGMSRPADNILKFRPNAIITHGMGPRTLSVFQNAGIAVLRANANIVREVIEAYRQDTPEELTEGCYSARYTPQNKRV